jgi:hypothetical protein
MSHTARTYNITVNHRRRTLSTTTGHPARWNDKTLILFDDFVVGLHEGCNLDDFTFELYERDARGNVVSAKYRGPWLIVDHGYCNWSTTVPPMKRTCDRAEIRFSQWLESIRKDVECTFGILKGRFRVLKTGIRLNGQEAADKVFLTCCALHNWLLRDRWAGYQLGGKKGVQASGKGPWEIMISRMSTNTYRLQLPGLCHQPKCGHTTLLKHQPWFHNERINQEHQGAPQNKLAPLGTRHISQRVGRRYAEQQEGEIAPIPGAVRVVKDLSLAYFRNKLIQHFDISFQRNEIIWPGKRNQVAHLT